MDEVFIALLDILNESNQALGSIPFDGGDESNQTNNGVANENEEGCDSDLSKIANQDTGYPFSFCDGVYFGDILDQSVVYRQQLERLGDVLDSKVAKYNTHRHWLEEKLVDDIFTIRSSSAASISVLEEVQGKTLAVMDAIALYEMLKGICISPGQLKVTLSGNCRVLQTAGVLFPLSFTVTENPWVFEPTITSTRVTAAVDSNQKNWFFHAMVQVLYRLIMDGGYLHLAALGGQGSFSVSVQTLRGVEHLGLD